MLIGQILKELYHLKDEDIERALKLQKEVKNYLGQILIQLGVITERQLIYALSKQLNIPVFDEEESSIEELSESLSELDLNLHYLLENGFLPIKITENTVSVITNDPLKVYVVDYITKKLNRDCLLFLAEERKIKALAKRLITKEEGHSFVIERDAEKLKDMALEAPVIKYLNDLISRAVELNASDIHLEPSQHNFKVKLRVDGILHDFDELREDFFLAIVSRIKLLSGLDIAEKRLPQDGKFSTKIGSSYVDMRVSTVPTVTGEDVVIRILYRGRLSFNLAELGLEPDHYHLVREMINKPYGMILVTGPTGSGKTTTLYSIISTIKSSEKKIITVEDPVEYQLDGLTQIQVKPDIGLSFANTLRSILRHDPDIIMIGEIRDRETAQIAVQSALTGHLVLSTLHTNDSLSTLFRLLDMGIENYLINASLIGVIAQRIVRVNCPYCSIEGDIESELMEKFNLSHLRSKFETLIEKPIFKKGKGCKYCLNTGFKGRTAIFEVLTYNDDLKELFIKTSSLSAMREYLNSMTSFRTLREDGLIKVMKGITTVEEILRVI
ncbi:MAG: ATPase, T2SS/T4P/T4SS family [Candidatus Aenigmatarchaeota archaeon]